MIMTHEQPAGEFVDALANNKANDGLEGEYLVQLGFLTVLILQAYYL